MHFINLLLTLFALWAPLLIAAPTTPPNNSTALLPASVSTSDLPSDSIKLPIAIADLVGKWTQRAYLYETGPDSCGEVWGAKDKRPPLRGDSQVYYEIFDKAECATYYGEGCADGTRIHEYQGPAQGRFEGILITYRCWY